MLVTSFLPWYGVLGAFRFETVEQGVVAVASGNDIRHVGTDGDKVSVAEAEAGFNKEVGERLRHIREVHGLTITEVASRLNVTRQSLANYELGKTPVRASVMRELAEMYHVPGDWILGLRDDFEVRVEQSKGRTVTLSETSPQIVSVSRRSGGA